MQNNHESTLSEDKEEGNTSEQLSPPINDSQEEMNKYKDKYLRAIAENENTRKRLYKEREEYAQFSAQNVLSDFLHPIDQLERALAFADQANDEIKHWALGFQMILTEFQNALSQNGVRPMETKGALFDPNRHEATEVVPTSDYPEGYILEENSKGYLIGDKTLRPARVKVAKTPLSAGNETNDESNDSQNT